MRLEDLAGRATVTVPEAAQLLGLSAWAYYEAVKRDEVPYVRVGRRVLVPVPKLREMLGDPEAPPARGPLELDAHHWEVASALLDKPDPYDAQTAKFARSQQRVAVAVSGLPSASALLTPGLAGLLPRGLEEAASRAPGADEE